MRRFGSRTLDVVLVAAMLAIPVIAVLLAIEGHWWFLALLGVSFALQTWRAKLGGRYVPVSVLRRLPGRRGATSPEGEHE